jgi:hypothetical protein
VDDLHVEYWPSVPEEIQVSGSYAYLASTYQGFIGTESSIVITDVSDPDGPRIVGKVHDFDGVEGIKVSGERLFVIGERGEEDRAWSHPLTLRIVDISDPKNPERVWISGAYRGSLIDVVDDSLFLADRDGLQIIDVADPSNPIDVGLFEANWVPSDLAVEGGFAYVALPEEGLRIIDASDPANPVEVGSLSNTWEALDLAVLDGFAYVADGAGGLRVIDASNPAAPVEVATLETGREAKYVSVDGSHAIVGLVDKDIWIIDLSNPAKPKRVHLFATEGPALAAVLSSTTAYMTEGGSDSLSNSRFRVVDLSVPDSPVERASFGYRSAAMDVAVADGVRYIASGDTGLYVSDDADPNESFRGFLDTPGFALGVTPHGDVALVADGHKGLRVIDVADPSKMAEVGFVDTPGRSRRVAVGGDYASVADGDAGLRVVDISSPSNPTEIGFLDTLGEALDVAVSGDYAYVSDGPGGLLVIDVSDRTQPTEVASVRFTPDAIVRSAAVAGNVAFIVYDYGRTPKLEVRDVSDPTRPRTIGSDFWLQGEGTDIALSGEFAFVATRANGAVGTGLGGVEVIDISDPTRLAAAGTWNASGDALPVRSDALGDALGISASSGRVYTACELAGAAVFDARCLTTYWVDIVAHQSGLDGSEWRTDVIINHEQWRRDMLYNTKSKTDVAVEFILHTQQGEFTGEGAIEREGQGVFEDIVGLLGYNGKGALEIRADIPVKVSSRVYNQSESGTQGAYYPGYRSSDCLDGSESGWLYGLRQVQGEFRTNISVTNTGTDTTWADITLYRTDGTRLVGYSVEVEPGMVVQTLQPFKNRAAQPNLGWGFAEVRGGGIIASASVIDSRTNDAVTVPMTR